MLERSVESASRLLLEDRPIEAAQLVGAARRVDAEYPGLAELDAEILRSGAAVSDVFAPSLLGANRQRRVSVDRSMPVQALLYLPDRVVDLLDVFTCEIHMGTGAYLDAHVTRALQSAAGFRALLGVGTYSSRTILGSRVHANVGLTVLPLGAQAQGGSLVSADGIRTGYQTLAGLHAPWDEYYQEYEDYWAIGVSHTLLIGGGTVEIHPMQLADFVAGLVFLDLLRDDFARTRGLDLTSQDEELILDLARVVRSETSLLAYAEFKAAGQPRPSTRVVKGEK
jgi:hypothetical protein